MQQVKDKKDFILRFYDLSDKIMPPSSGTEAVDENSAVYKDAFNNFDKYLESIRQALQIHKNVVNEKIDKNEEDPDFLGYCLCEIDRLLKFLNEYEENKK